MRLKQWPSTTKPVSSDVLIMDGSEGTRTISYTNLKKDIVSGINVPDGGGSSGPSDMKAYVTNTGSVMEGYGLPWYWRIWSDGTAECWTRGETVRAQSNEQGIAEFLYNYPLDFVDGAATASVFASESGDMESYVGYGGSNERNELMFTVVGKAHPGVTNVYYIAIYAIGKVDTTQ